MIKNIILTVCILLYLLSVHILVDYRGDTAFSLWQFLDTKLLHEHFLQSLYLLHSQPPLLNFILGIGLKLDGDNFSNVTETLQYGLLVANIFLLRRICRLLDLPEWIAWLTMLSPSIYLYGNWFYEPIYSFTFINCALYGLLEFHKKKGLIAFLSMLMLLSLTHSAFNPFMLIAFAIISYYYLKNITALQYSGKYFISAVMIVFLPSLLITLKNFLVFGILTSSWAGCNLAQMSPVGFAGYDTFKDPAPKQDLTVLNTPYKSNTLINLNYYKIIDQCRHAGETATTWAMHYPNDYMHRVLDAFILIEKNRSYDFDFVIGEWTKAGKAYFDFLHNFVLGPVEPLFPFFIFLSPLAVLIIQYKFACPGARPRKVANIAPLIALYYIHLLIICFFNGVDLQRLNMKFYFFLVICSVILLWMIGQTFLKIIHKFLSQNSQRS